MRCEYKTCKKVATYITKKRLSGFIFTTHTCDDHTDLLYTIDFKHPIDNLPTNINTVTYDGRHIHGIE